MQKRPKVFIGIPMLREWENIEYLLFDLKSQTYSDFELIACVNQPDDWWDNPEKKYDCVNNQETIKKLVQEKDIRITIIDKSSKDKGWKGKEKGVGWARKLIFEKILEKAEKHDIIISLDADTKFSENYVQSVIQRFQENPNAGGIAVPYFHRLTEDEKQNRLILYYEIYMRYYLLNLLKIESPYAFTALGSAIAFTADIYKKIGGITPVEAGEDFYLIQKICKKSQLLLWNSEYVYPSARISDRVPFGTGQAVNKSINESLMTFPLYSIDSFEKIKKSYDLFPPLFTQEIEIPITDFLQKQLKTENLWEPLRKNFKTKEQFVKACHERFDGLRILQFLKANQPDNFSNEKELQRFFDENYHHKINDFSFSNCSIKFLSDIRDFLFEKELGFRKIHENLSKKK